MTSLGSVYNEGIFGHRASMFLALRALTLILKYVKATLYVYLCGIAFYFIITS